MDGLLWADTDAMIAAYMSGFSAASAGLGDEVGLAVDGLAALNRAYEAMFAENPALHGRWAGLYVRHKGSLPPRR